MFKFYFNSIENIKVTLIFILFIQIICIRNYIVQSFISIIWVTC